MKFCIIEWFKADVKKHRACKYWQYGILYNRLRRRTMSIEHVNMGDMEFRTIDLFDIAKD